MLSIEFKESVSNVVAASVALDGTSKELFMLAHKEYYKVSNEALKSTNKDLNDYLKDSIKSDIVRAGVKRVMNVAFKYSSLKALTYLDDLVYENIKGTVTLLSYIEKEHDKEDLKKVKTRLAKVKKDTEYNNTFRRTLQQIKSEYPIVVTEEGEVIKLSGVKVMDVVANNITELSEEQKAELVALLQA